MTDSPPGTHGNSRRTLPSTWSGVFCILLAEARGNQLRRAAEGAELGLGDTQLYFTGAEDDGAELHVGLG